MKKLLYLLLIFFVSCEDDFYSYEEYPDNDHHDPQLLDPFLHIYAENLEYNGEVYIFNYPEGNTNSYFKVDYHSLPQQRVFWNSPDMFYVEMWNDTIWTEVVNYSTYADDTATGHQLVYVNPTLIGDTLNVIGTINNILYVPVLQEEILIKIQ